MRDIKFRIRILSRDGEHKETLYIPLSGSSNSLLNCPIDIEEWDIISIDEFTGLKDKNGTEIYEGDIVKDAEQEYAKPRCSQIFVCNFKALPWQGAFNFTNTKRDFDFGNDTSCNFEVIGNIHENPELLDVCN